MERNWRHKRVNGEELEIQEANQRNRRDTRGLKDVIIIRGAGETQEG